MSALSAYALWNYLVPFLFVLSILTSWGLGISGNFAHYRSVGDNNDKQWYEVHENDAHKIVKHFLGWRCEESKRDTLRVVRIFWMGHHAEYKTLQKNKGSFEYILVICESEMHYTTLV